MVPLSFALCIVIAAVALWAKVQLLHRYTRNTLGDARSRRLFWINKMAPLLYMLGLVEAAWLSGIWWVFAWALVFYAGVVVLVALTTRSQLKLFNP
jgi:hypothetical protein